jgi:DNA-binding CsgD family transcriptional regulator
VDRLLDALATMVIDGLPVAAPRLQQAVAAAVGAEESPHPDDGRRLELTARAARQLWDEAGWRELSDRRLALARGSGALAELPAALEDRVQLHLLAGENGEAAELVAELEAIAGSVRTGRPPYGAITLGAWHGHEPEVSALVRPAVEDAINRGEGAAIGAIRYAQAVLYNGLGRYDEALLAAADGAGDPGELGCAGWSLVELIEAAVRCRQRDTAATALGRLLDTTGPSGTSWAQGVEARSRALLAGDDAGDLYRNAIDHLGRTALPMELARTQLLYGEWLRRRRRRSAARECLRAAHATFVAMGADGFAERARRERLATGETVRAHRREPSDDLTAQEVQIARLAVDGRTNPEIAAELFLSPRTVEWHLRKVFTKLSISSRRQLRTVLPDVVRAGTRS